MKATRIVRRIDHLGRVVISEIRRMQKPPFREVFIYEII